MKKRALYVVTGALGCALVAAAVVASVTASSHQPARMHRNAHGATSLTTIFAGRSNEASRAAGQDSGGDEPGSLAQENYDNQAYPATSIAPAQILGSENAWNHDKEHGDRHSGGWQQVGPTSPRVPGLVSNAGTADTFQSGRVSIIERSRFSPCGGIQRVAAMAASAFCRSWFFSMLMNHCGVLRKISGAFERHECG